MVRSMRCWGVALCAAVGAAALSPSATWGCPPMLRVVVGVVRVVVQEPAAAARSGPADIPGAILEVKGPTGILRFRLSRNIGMTLEELRARARDGRSVQVLYEMDYDGKLRALDITGAEGG